MSDTGPYSKKKVITTHELLERSAESALELQREDGSFPPGRNYTYDEPETPVRTTSHWTVTLSEVYDITGKEKFREAADAAVDYLLSDEVRPYGYTYYCRDAPGKDHCNGLVGQAGPIRALAHAGPILERQDAIETAEEVFMLHPFDEELGLWERVEIDGKKLSFDRTLNHQILFAAGSSKLASESDIVTDRITTFLDRLPSNMEIHPDGLIKHYVRPPPVNAARTALHTPHHYELLVNEVVFHYYSRSKKWRKKERGYHTVNLLALSRIKRTFKSHELWESDRIKRSVGFLEDNMHELISKNETVHGSILPGISTAEVLIFIQNIDPKKVSDIISNDISTHIDNESFLLSKDQNKDNNKIALIYKLAYLPNTQIIIEDHQNATQLSDVI